MALRIICGKQRHDGKRLHRQSIGKHFLGGVFVLLLFAAQIVQADTVILSDHSFEGTSGMDFVGIYGDQDPSFYSIDSISPRTGSDHFVSDFGNNGAGNGFAGNYTGVTVNATSIGPMNYGNFFDITAYVAIDPADAPTDGFFDVFLGFFDAADDPITGAFASSAYDTSSFTTNYSLVSLRYTLNPTDLPDLSMVSRVEATLNSDSNLNVADGRVFVDDFRFVFTPVPEPGTTSLFLLAGMSVLAIRRKVSHEGCR